MNVSVCYCRILLLSSLMQRGSMSVCNFVFLTNTLNTLSSSSLFLCLLQDTERWERSVLKVAEISSALIRERSPALVGQLLQA